LVTRINAELANNIGNLAQRSLAMIYKNCEGKIPAGLEHAISHLEPFSENYFQYFNDLAFDKAIQAVIDFANLVNKNFNDTAPWNLLKQGKISEMQKSLHETAESLRLIAILLLPFVPVSANKILDLLNIENSARNFASLTHTIKAGHQINEPKAVFPRLESK